MLPLVDYGGSDSSDGRDSPEPPAVVTTAAPAPAPPPKPPRSKATPEADHPKPNARPRGIKDFFAKVSAPASRGAAPSRTSLQTRAPAPTPAPAPAHAPDAESSSSSSGSASDSDGSGSSSSSGGSSSDDDDDDDDDGRSSSSDDANDEDDTCVPVSSSSRVPKRDGRQYKFDERWKETRLWLRYESGRMWCSICVRFASKMRNVWADRSKGCTALRKEKASGVCHVFISMHALTPKKYVC